MTEDIRWQQRFSNYRKALIKLNTAIEVIEENKAGTDEDKESLEDIDEMLKEGLVKRFEYTYELAWNVMKDYAEFQGNFEVKGSRDATRAAFQMGLITDADNWMDMIESRKLTSHTYNQKTADEIHAKIVAIYHKLFLDFEKKMEGLFSGEQPDMFEKK